MDLRERLHKKEHLVTIDVPPDVSDGIEGLTATFRRLTMDEHASISENIHTSVDILHAMLTCLAVGDDTLSIEDIDWDEFAPQLTVFLVNVATAIQSEGIRAAGKVWRQRQSATGPETSPLPSLRSGLTTTVADTD